MTLSNSEKTVFFDRDGTLSIDKGYTTDPREMKIYPGAGSAVGAIKSANFRTVIVTNQSAVGRGMATVADVEATNAECLAQLAAEDARAVIDRVCYCPHAPEENCACRKPRTGMIDNLPWAFNVGGSWVVGDKYIDLEFGITLGIPVSQCILVLTGEGKRELPPARDRVGPELQVAADIGAAAAMIVGS